MGTPTWRARSRRLAVLLDSSEVFHGKKVNLGMRIDHHAAQGEYGLFHGVYPEELGVAPTSALLFLTPSAASLA
jgi:hypothetical protein